jgi:hypothetical protein
VATNCSADPTKNCEVPANGNSYSQHTDEYLDVAHWHLHQYGVGTAVVFGNSGWLGYGRSTIEPARMSRARCAGGALQLVI